MYDLLTSCEYDSCPLHIKGIQIPIYKLYRELGTPSIQVLEPEINHSKLHKDDVKSRYVQQQVDWDKNHIQKKWILSRKK